MLSIVSRLRKFLTLGGFAALAMVVGCGEEPPPPPITEGGIEQAVKQEGERISKEYGVSAPKAVAKSIGKTAEEAPKEAPKDAPKDAAKK